MTNANEAVDAAQHNDNQRRLVALETAIQELRTDTQELLDLFRTAKGGFRVVGWFGSFAKWSAGLAAACVGLYVAIQKIRGQ